MHRSPDDHPDLSTKRELTALCEVHDAETGTVLRTTFTFVDADNTAWFGQVIGVRKYDVSDEQMNNLLTRISDETVYPEVTSGLTLLAGGDDVKSYWIKRPQFLCLDNAEETKLLPKMLLGEARILEFLRHHPHKNLVHYHGCVTRRGRIVGLALEKYPVILQNRLRDDPRELDISACIKDIRDGVEHLHCLGLAHNDLNPMNIAFDADDRPVILDFGSCARFGEALLSGGTPGWVEEDFDVSAQHHDEIALQKIEAWMKENKSGTASSTPDLV